MLIVNNLIFFCIYFCFTLITCHNLFHTFFATKKVHLYGLFFNIFPIPALAKQPTSGNKHKQLRCICTLSEPHNAWGIEPRTRSEVLTILRLALSPRRHSLCFATAKIYSIKSVCQLFSCNLLSNRRKFFAI